MQSCDGDKHKVRERVRENIELYYSKIADLHIMCILSTFYTKILTQVHKTHSARLNRPSQRFPIWLLLALSAGLARPTHPRCCRPLLVSPSSVACQDVIVQVSLRNVVTCPIRAPW